jgi:transposase, IS6 family
MSITAARPFKGRQYSGEVILTAVRWYLRYPLAYEHVAELLADGDLPCVSAGVKIDHIAPR